MHVGMLLYNLLVRMLMLMMFNEVQPQPRAHQHSGGNQPNSAPGDTDGGKEAAASIPCSTSSIRFVAAVRAAMDTALIRRRHLWIESVDDRLTMNLEELAPALINVDRDSISLILGSRRRHGRKQPHRQREPRAGYRCNLCPACTVGGRSPNIENRIVRERPCWRNASCKRMPPCAWGWKPSRTGPGASCGKSTPCGTAGAAVASRRCIAASGPSSSGRPASRNAAGGLQD